MATSRSGALPGSAAGPLAVVPEAVARTTVSDAPTPKGRRRQSELLAAARDTFAEHGYFDTRVEDIAQRANVSRATFYTYFDSKDEVLAVIVGELVDDLFAASAEAAEPEATPYLALEATIRQFMHAYRDRATMIRILEQAVAFSDEFLTLRLQIRARFGERLTGIIRAHQAPHAGVGHDLDPELASYALGGMVDDFARGCYVLNQLVDDDAAIATLTAIWARAIGLDDEPVAPARSPGKGSRKRKT